MKMKYLAAALAAAALAVPATAQADSPICHNGVLSDDAGQGCADGLYKATYTGGSSSSVCTDGVLSNDAGQGCADGLYERVYGGATASTATATTSTSYHSDVAETVPVSSGGYAAAPESIAQCESGGNPATNTGNGFYGKWQFTTQTWQAVTGLSGNASDYPEAVQDAAAAKLYANGAGAGNWPVCSQQ